MKIETQEMKLKDGIEKVFEKAYAFTNEISIDDF